MLVLPFSPSHCSIQHLSIKFGVVLCVLVLFSLCGLWQHRMSGERAGPLQTGRMFDMGHFFLCWSRKGPKFFLPTLIAESRAGRSSWCSFTGTAGRNEADLAGSSRGSVMLTQTKLGSWTPSSAAGKLPRLQNNPCIFKFASISQLHWVIIS